MNIQRIECNTLVPQVIVEGVKGGGYIVIADYTSGAPIGTSLDHFPKDPYKDPAIYTFASFPYLRGNKIWLDEGSKFYGVGTYDSYYNKVRPCVYTVIYLDSEPIHQQEASPINLSGTIQLNQQ